MLSVRRCATLYICSFFFFNDTATTEIYTLSLHDALPICRTCPCLTGPESAAGSCTSASTWPPIRLGTTCAAPNGTSLDRKSTRLNSSHGYISYAVFCLKKKKKKKRDILAIEITIQSTTNT